MKSFSKWLFRSPVVCQGSTHSHGSELSFVPVLCLCAKWTCLLLFYRTWQGESLPGPTMIFNIVSTFFKFFSSKSVLESAHLIAKRNTHTHIYLLNLTRTELTVYILVGIYTFTKDRSICALDKSFYLFSFYLMPFNKVLQFSPEMSYTLLLDLFLSTLHFLL